MDSATEGPEAWPGANLEMDTTGFTPEDMEIWQKIDAAFNPEFCFS